MSTGTVARPKVVLDTNIIISGLGFGGKPRTILQLIVDRKIRAITSSILLAELTDVVTKKFPKLTESLEKTNKQIKERFKIVRPEEEIHVIQDEDDNRILEAAIKGRCAYIITGDRDLLDLKAYRNIKILTPSEFLDIVEKT